MFEIIIVLALVGIIASFGLFVSMDFYRSYVFRSERSVIISTLEKARIQSMTNINQAPHGVHYDGVNKDYVLFEGPTFNQGAATNMIIEGNNSVSVAGFSDVVFEQLSGDANAVSVTLRISFSDELSKVVGYLKPFKI